MGEFHGLLYHCAEINPWLLVVLNILSVYAASLRVSLHLPILSGSKVDIVSIKFQNSGWPKTSGDVGVTPGNQDLVR